MGPHGNIVQRQALPGALGAILEQSARVWAQLWGPQPPCGLHFGAT